jgi:hypothetical protein
MLSSPDIRPTEEAPLSTRRYVLLLAGLVAVAVAAYTIPFFGFPLSVLLGVLTHQARQRLWPGVSPRTSVIWSVLAVVGIWWPAVVDMGGAFVAFNPFYDRGIIISTSWLLLPIGGPDNTAAWVWPALVAAGVLLLGLVLTVFSRRPWPWLLAAWSAPWVHMWVISQIPHTWIA